MIVFLLGIIAVGSLIFGGALLTAWRRQGAPPPSGEGVAIGFVTNFFDTLGISSFATTLSWFTFRGLVPARAIPATMLTGHSLPTMVQAAIFLVLLGARVDPWLLGSCVLALGIGSFVGARLVPYVSTAAVQATVSVALLIGAGFFVATNLGLLPAGGTAGTLPPLLFAIAVAANALLGALLNFGIGNFAPTLLMLTLFGMDPHLAFPIMMAGGALAVTLAGSHHCLSGQADIRMVISIAIGGIPAVLIAALIVKSLPMDTLRWLVLIVVLYAAYTMARSAMRSWRTAAAA